MGAKENIKKRPIFIKKVKGITVLTS